MRVTKRLLATASAAGAAGGLSVPPVALLPPIPLYRRLLRAHRSLPREMRVLGDQYVKKEFRDHQKVENPVHIIGFLTEWQMYAQQIEGDSWRGERLDKSKIDKLSDQQLGQMYELMQAIQKYERGDDEGEAT